jgi:hypothetical protein
VSNPQELSQCGGLEAPFGRQRAWLCLEYMVHPSCYIFFEDGTRIEFWADQYAPNAHLRHGCTDPSDSDWWNHVDDEDFPWRGALVRNTATFDTGSRPKEEWVVRMRWILRKGFSLTFGDLAALVPPGHYHGGNMPLAWNPNESQPLLVTAQRDPQACYPLRCGGPFCF